MADKKVTELTDLTVPAGEDLLLVVDNPDGTPVSKRVSLQALFGAIPSNTAITGTLTVSGDTFVITTSKTPATASSTGTQGQIAWDSDYLYICVATNTWKRVAISTW